MNQPDLFSQVEIVQSMTVSEAKECVREINEHLGNARQKIYELYQRDGWRVLGYASWRECVTAEFGQSKSQLYRELEAAKIERGLISPIGETEIDSPMGEIGQIPERQLRPLSALKDPEQQREAWHRAQETAPDGNLTGAHVQKVVQEYKESIQPTRPKRADYVTLEEWEVLSYDERLVFLSADEMNTGATFNRQNTSTYGDTEGGGDIEWALWSWNPVTGCLHNCPYCYARDIANRFYEQKFNPALIPSRLSAPANTKQPDLSRVDNPVMRMGLKNVFTCSMADLFGKWVPGEWIEAVLEQIRNNPQWNFLLLTKFPVRMAEFEYPANVWLGTSVDHQWSVERAEKAFRKIKASGFSGICWLSCEPMMERLTFTSLDMFDWVVIGGASKSTQTKEFRPPREWINHLEAQVEQAGAMLYEKTNLLERIRQYPA